MKLNAIVALSVFIVLSGASLEATESLDNSKAPDFELPDQNEQVHTLRSFAGQTVVLIAGDKNGEEQCHQWGALIHKKYGRQIRIVRIANVRKAPFFLKGKIKNDFKKDPHSVLFDWDGIVFRSYGFKDEVPNIVLVDKSGILRFLYSGSPEPRSVDRLFREIDRTQDGIY